MASGGGGGKMPKNMQQSYTTAPNAGAGGLGNIVNAMFGQMGIQTDPYGGFSGKDRKRYDRLLDLRSKGKRYGKQAQLEEKLGLSPGGSPSPFIGDAPDFTSFELNPELNPYLNSVFNRAADLTRTRLDTEFAGAGRNAGAAIPARSEELQTLGLGIFDPTRLAQFDPLTVALQRLGGLIPMSGMSGDMIQRKGQYKQGLF